MPLISDLVLESKIDRRESEELLAFVLQKDRSFVLAHKTDTVDAKLAKKFLALCARRQKNEPIAYLTGSQPFYGRGFLVNRHTLIPRPETEVLASLVLKHLKRRTLRTDRTIRTQEDVKDVIVDIGTGSGCLALTLALECPKATVIASDITDLTLKVARQNAKRLAAKVTFMKENLLGVKLKSVLASKTKTLDVGRCTWHMTFVANLPYLPTADKEAMMADVTKFEPSKALFAGSDGLSLIVKLLNQISVLCHSEQSSTESKNLARSRSLDFARDDKRGVSIFLEIDPRQTKKLTAMAHQLFPKHTIKIEQDLCGRERFLTII